MRPRLDRVLLRRKPERVPADRVEHVAPPHPRRARDDVRRGVALRVADVQTRPARVREHVEDVGLWPRGVELPGQVRSPKGLVLVPDALPFGLDLRERVGFRRLRRLGLGGLDRRRCLLRRRGRRGRGSRDGGGVRGGGCRGGMGEGPGGGGGAASCEVESGCGGLERSSEKTRRGRGGAKSRVALLRLAPSLFVFYASRHCEREELRFYVPARGAKAPETRRRRRGRENRDSSRRRRRNRNRRRRRRLRRRRQKAVSQPRSQGPGRKARRHRRAATRGEAAACRTGGTRRGRRPH